MQYDVNTPKEYLKNLEGDWRLEKVQALRKIIKAKDPKLSERINYKMLAFGEGDRIAFHLNAQKNYVSLYVGEIKKIDPTGELVKGLSCGKVCVRFSKSKDVAETRIDEFIERTLELWHQGVDMDC